MPFGTRQRPQASFSVAMYDRLSHSHEISVEVTNPLDDLAHISTHRAAKSQSRVFVPQCTKFTLTSFYGMLMTYGVSTYQKYPEVTLRT